MKSLCILHYELCIAPPSSAACSPAILSAPTPAMESVVRMESAVLIESVGSLETRPPPQLVRRKSPTIMYNIFLILVFLILAYNFLYSETLEPVSYDDNLRDKINQICWNNPLTP